MEKLRKYIRKELQSLHEQKSYPVPLELMDVLKGELEMRPLKRYINNIKAVNSIPPSYKIFLHNGQDFDVIYLGDQMNNFKVRILDKEYDLLVMDDKNYAIDALNRLLTAPLPPNFGGDDDEKKVMETLGDHQVVEDLPQDLVVEEMKVELMMTQLNQMKTSQQTQNQNQT